MQFSERKELENLITYSKSFKMKDNLSKSSDLILAVDDVFDKDSPRPEVVENDSNVDITSLLAGVGEDKDFFEEIKTYVTQLEVNEMQS